MKIKKQKEFANSLIDQKENQNINQFSQLLAFKLQFSPFFDMSILLNTPISKFTSKYEYDIQFDFLSFKEDYRKAMSQIFLFQTDLCEKLKKHSIVGRMSDVIAHLVQYLNRISDFCFHKVQIMRQKIQNDKKEINQLKNIFPKSQCQNCREILSKEKIKNIRNQLLQLPKFYDSIIKDQEQLQNSNRSDEINSLECFLISQEKMKNKLLKLQTNLDQRKYDISTCLIQLGQFKNKVVDYSNRRINTEQTPIFNGQKMVFEVGQYFYKNIKQVQSQLKQIKRKFNHKTTQDQEIQVDTISKKIQKQIQMKKKKLQFTYKTKMEQLQAQNKLLTQKLSQFQVAYAKYMKNQQKNDNLLIYKGITELQLKKNLQRINLRNLQLQEELNLAKKLLNKAKIPHTLNQFFKQNYVPMIESINNNSSSSKQNFSSHTTNKFNSTTRLKKRFGKQRRKTSIFNQLNEHLNQIKRNPQNSQDADFVNEIQQVFNNNLEIFLNVVDEKIDPSQFQYKKQSNNNKINLSLKPIKNKSRRNLTVAESANSKVNIADKNIQQSEQKYNSTNFKRSKSKKKLNQKLNTESKSQEKTIIRYGSEFQGSKQKFKKLQAIYKKKKPLDLFQSKDQDSKNKMALSHNELQRLKSQKDQQSKKNISLYQMINKKISEANNKKSAELTKKRKKRNFSQDYQQKKYIIDYIPGCQITENQQEKQKEKENSNSIQQIFTSKDQEEVFGVINMRNSKLLKKYLKTNTNANNEQQQANQQKQTQQKKNHRIERNNFNFQKNNSNSKEFKIEHDILKPQQLNYSTFLYTNLATLHIMDKLIYKQIRQFLVKPFIELQNSQTVQMPNLKSIVGYLLIKHRKCFKGKKQQICDHMQNFLMKIGKCKNLKVE